MAEERISYGDISNSCNNLTNLASSMKDTNDSIQSAINQITDPTWDGTAATSYVEKIRSLCNHLPEANRQLAEAVLFLASCADGYKSIDEASKQKLIELIGGQEYIDNYDVSKAPDIDPSSRVSLEENDNSKTEKSKENNSNSDSPSRKSSSGGTSGASSYSGYSSGASVAGGVASAATPTIVKKEEEKETETEKELEIDSLEKGEHAEIPESLVQDEYKTTPYDKDNKFESGSNEASVETIWKSQGSNFNENIATVKVEGEERYLVKVSPKYGQVGDSIDVNLKDGSVVKCVIAENKSITGNNANAYGTTGTDGKVNILEFETKTLQEKETINYQWDEKSPVSAISNNGSVLNNQAEATKIVENKTYPIPETTEFNPVESPESITNTDSSTNIVTEANTDQTTTITTNMDNSQDTTQVNNTITVESSEG